MSLFPSLNASVPVEVSEYFTGYEEDFRRYAQRGSQLLSQIEAAIHNWGERRNAMELLGLARDCELQIKEAETCLRQMKVEAQCMPSSSLSSLLQRYSNDLQDTKAALAKAQQTLQTIALRPAPTRQQAGRDGGHQRLVGVATTLDESNRTLEESRRLAVDTEDLGMNIMGELRGQRETMLRSTQLAAESGNSISASRQLLARMRQRLVLNRTILYASIGLLSISILLLIYLKFAK